MAAHKKKKVKKPAGPARGKAATAKVNKNKPKKNRIKKPSGRAGTKTRRTPKKASFKKTAPKKAPPKASPAKAPPTKILPPPRPGRYTRKAHLRGETGTRAALGRGIYDKNLERNPANYQPLTPLSFLARAADVFADHTAIVHGEQRFSYAQFYARARALASALQKHGIAKGDTVAVLLANTPPMLEVHYGVPMLGAVLATLNTRLDPAAIAYMLDHSEAKILIADREFSVPLAKALALAKNKPPIVDYDDPQFPQTGARLGTLDYEALLAEGDADFAWRYPADEWDAISLNYTSGTTGDPKGAVYHHRGAALMGYGNVIAAGMGPHPVLLWTLPMFHCNGWCFPWSLSVVAGTHVCLRQVRAAPIYEAIARHKVTHLCGAPIVMSALINADETQKRSFSHTVNFVHAAAPPPQAVIDAMTEAGFALTHIYGLTETYGPATVNEWNPAWDTLDGAARSQLRLRQGVRYHPLEGLAVLDPQSLEPVPADGTSLGEVMFRGNIVMKGYLKNPRATREAFAGGWFHSGDLGVMHPDGYIQLKDRSKDIIISGGENISSIEVENVLSRHPAVLFAAVVAKPDEKWGETPCAFIEKRPGHDHVTAQDMIEHCRAHLAHYKCPRFVVFADVPKTPTGKVQKFLLREMARALP
jgi:fatty-acyl-CoA synthase